MEIEDLRGRQAVQVHRGKKADKADKAHKACKALLVKLDQKVIQAGLEREAIKEL